MRWRRLRTDDDGAVAIIVALLLVPMLAMTALVVDAGALYLRKSELQNAADAAALAIAADCGRGACGNVTSTAESFTGQKPDAGNTVTPAAPSSSVTVRAATTVNHSFASAIGIKSSVVRATSTAQWGAPSGGTAVLPLIFSWCSFDTENGRPVISTEQTIYFPKSDTNSCPGRPGSNNFVPGGFGWITTHEGKCAAKTSIHLPMVNSNTGNAIPDECKGTPIESLVGKTVLLPVFDDFGDNGGNAWYHVYAYAAFHLTGYYFNNQNKWPDKGPPCSGEDRCIRGYFTKMVGSSEAFTYSDTAPKLGASVVVLSCPDPLNPATCSS